MRAALVTMTSILALVGCAIDDLKFDFDFSSDSGTGSSKSTCQHDSGCGTDQCCGGGWTQHCIPLHQPDAADPECEISSTQLDSGGPMMCVCSPPKKVATCPHSGWFSGTEATDCPDTPYLRCKATCQNTCICENFDSGQVPDDWLEVPTCPPDWNALCPDAG